MSTTNVSNNTNSPIPDVNLSGGDLSSGKKTNNEPPPLVVGRLETGQDKGSSHVPKIDSSFVATGDLFSNVAAMGTELAKITIEQQSEERKFLYKSRKDVVNAQMEQAQKKKDAAENRKTAQIIMGVTSILGGLAGVGLGAAGSFNKMSATSAMVYGQAMTSLSDGVGQAASAKWTHDADMDDAEVKIQEALETAHRALVQDSDTAMQQAREIINKCLDQITKTTDTHAEGNRAAHRI